MLTVEADRRVDEKWKPYEYDFNDPINNEDPSGLSATRTYLAGSETTNFHTTKEVSVLQDGRRQVTYRLFLSRAETFSAGVGAPGQVSRSDQEITNTQQIFSGPQAAQTETIVDKAVAWRVDSLNQIDAANARVDNMQFGFGLVPFFSAVDNYLRGKPWKLDAAISALSLAPAVAGAIRSALPLAEAATSARAGGELAVAGDGLIASDALAGQSACFPPGTPVAVVVNQVAAGAVPAIQHPKEDSQISRWQLWGIRAALSATALAGWYVINKRHRNKGKQNAAAAQNDDRDDELEPMTMPLLPAKGG